MTKKTQSCHPELIVYDPETSSGSKNGFRHPELVSGTILEMGGREAINVCFILSLVICLRTRFRGLERFSGFSWFSY